MITKKNNSSRKRILNPYNNYESVNGVRFRRSGFPVGSVFYLLTGKYKVVKQGEADCESCSLCNQRVCRFMLCSYEKRLDSENVIFRKL